MPGERQLQGNDIRQTLKRERRYLLAEGFSPQPQRGPRNGLCYKALSSAVTTSGPLSVIWSFGHQLHRFTKDTGHTNGCKQNAMIRGR